MRDLAEETQTLIRNAQYIGDGYSKVFTVDIEAVQEALSDLGIVPEEPKAAE